MTPRNTAKRLSLIASVLCLALSTAHADDSIYVTHCGEYDLVGRLHCPLAGGACSIVLFEGSMAESEVVLTGPVAALRSYDGHRMRIRAEITGLAPLVATASPRSARAGLVSGTLDDAHLLEGRDCIKATAPQARAAAVSTSLRRFERRP